MDLNPGKTSRNGRTWAKRCSMHRFYNEALSIYNRLIKKDTKKADYYVQRGIAKQNLADLQGALADYDTAIQIDPKLPSAYDNRGSLKLAMSDIDGALSDINKAISIQEDNDEAYFTRAQVKMIHKRLFGRAPLMIIIPACHISLENTKVYAYRASHAESFIRRDYKRKHERRF